MGSHKHFCKVTGCCHGQSNHHKLMEMELCASVSCMCTMNECNVAILYICMDMSDHTNILALYTYNSLYSLYNQTVHVESNCADHVPTSSNSHTDNRPRQNTAL